MEITITRALSELKTLQKRYSSAVEDLKLAAVQQGEKLRAPYTSYKVEDFKDQAKESLQGADALYARIIAIKTAIDKSNSVTTIKIGQEELTIQEALVRKKYIDLKREKLIKLKDEIRAARNEYDKADRENNDLIERMVSRDGGSGTTDAQKASIRIEAESFVKNTKSLTLIDPLGLDKLVKDLENEIEEFESNIDYALSESNSTTNISIPD